MNKKLTESNISNCQAKFNLTYHVVYAYWCQQLIQFEGKDVLEVGGSLPEEFVSDYLNVKSWSGIESPNYEVSLSEIGSSSQGSNLCKINDYTNLSFIDRNLSNYNFFAANIEDLPTNYYQKYDLIFSIAAFEHIHKFPQALEKMFLALQPGGQLFAVFSPIWSAHDGHHLPPITETRQGNTFDFHNSPIPPWGHLLMTPPELCRYLYQFTDKETANLITYYVYNSNHINRFFPEDYINFIKQTSFKVKRFDTIGLVKVERHIQERLEQLYPGRTQFANNGILIILEKPQNELFERTFIQNHTFSEKQVNKIEESSVLKPVVKYNRSLKVDCYQQNKPRIDVVLQATGIHGWSFSHGWANVLHKEGLLHRVFTPVADFAAEEPKYDNGLFEYLENPQADIILLLGFDWHSQPLHRTAKWQERWRKAQIKKIALLQECYSAEVVQNTPEWKQRMHQAITSTASCVDGLICHHEPDVEFLQKEENILVPMVFLPFYIDAEYFKNKIPFEQRANRAFFKGKAPQYFTENAYNERRKLIEVLTRCKDVELFQLQTNILLTNPVEAVEAYISDLNSYQIQLNLPSLAPTLTVRPFEVMGCGGLLLQNKIIGDKSNELFQDWQHLVYYDVENTNDLISKINYLIENPSVANNITEQGYKICHENHTIKHRIQQILKWTDNDFKEQDNIIFTDSQNKFEEKNRFQQELVLEDRSSKPKIIVDGVFFQLYQTGIARVWKALLQEWVANGFANHIVVLDRVGTAPKIPGISYRSIPAYDYDRTDDDRTILQQVCDEESADLFISSYYTTPLSTPSIFMAHDMIPELMGANLNHPMWREKHYGIKHGSAYIAVSENTAHDLTRFFPEISLEDVTVAQNGVNHKIFSPASPEDINQFKAKYGILKPYFLLVGARGGYKNTILFFKAFAQLYSKQGFDIVCTGSSLLLETEIRSYTSGSIVQMLQLTDEELSIAYSGATALVYPSKYEGFGLPVLEAIACGCPVITCPHGSIPEVAGEAALYVNDEDVNGLTNALCEVQKPNVRNLLISAGFKQAKKFSWTKMAETVSSALIKATLLPLNLKDINLIIFPDWSQPEELLCYELEQVIRAIATHPNSSQMTLLVDDQNIADEEAALILSSVTMNLLMQEDLDVSEGPEISFVGKLGKMQWKALLPHIHARIALKKENQEAIALMKVETIPSYDLDSFTTNIGSI